MINSISKWAGSIVITVIIVTILEMILPESKSKKYIKTIMGIYILFTIISPIINNVFGKEIDIESLIETQNNNFSLNSSSIQTSASIENIYISSLKKDISMKLKQKDYLMEDADFEIEKNDESNYGKIYQINLVIKKADNSLQDEKRSNIPIIEISIGNTGLKKKLSDECTITENEKNELRDYLSSIYDVKPEKITIKEAIDNDSR